MTTEPVTKPVEAESSSEEHDSTQRIHELEETLERERREHKLKMLELQREAELMKQRLEQQLQLREHEAKIKEEENIYLQELLKTKGKDISTPTQDQTTVLAEALKTIMEESRLQLQAIINNFTIPKIEISKFDGNPLRYWPFIKSFENVIENKIKDNSIRLDILVQHCTGEVHDLLQCCLLKNPNEGYVLARTLLKETYGDDEAIACTWLDKILKRPRLKALKDIRAYANDLKTCHETLHTMSYLNELETRSNLRAIVEKLPDYIYDRWVEENYSIREREGRPGKLSDIIKFVEKIAKEASDSTFPAQDITDCSRDTQKNPREEYTPINTKQINNSPHRTVTYGCPKCKEPHYLNQCSWFRVLSIADRNHFVECENLCPNCLQPGHKADSCVRPWVCNVNGCSEKHNRWLHPTSTTTLACQPAVKPHIQSSPQMSSVSIHFVDAHMHQKEKPIVEDIPLAPESRSTDSNQNTPSYKSLITDNYKSMVLSKKRPVLSNHKPRLTRDHPNKNTRIKWNSTTEKAKKYSLRLPAAGVSPTKTPPDKNNAKDMTDTATSRHSQAPANNANVPIFCA